MIEYIIPNGWTTLTGGRASPENLELWQVGEIVETFQKNPDANVLYFRGPPDKYKHNLAGREDFKELLDEFTEEEKQNDKIS